jgi:DNA-binding NarL/FixJ family response regulator
LAELTAIAVTLPSLAADLVASILTARTRITVAARFETREAAQARLATMRPDVVLIGLFKSETDHIVREMLAASPRSTIVTMSDDGRLVRVCAADSRVTVLRDASPAQIAAAVMSALVRRSHEAPGDLDP